MIISYIVRFSEMATEEQYVSNYCTSGCALSVPGARLLALLLCRYELMLEAIRRLRSRLEEGQQYRRLHELAAVEVLCHLHNGDSVAASDAYNAACS